MIPGSAIPLLLATAGPTFNPRDYFDVKLYTGNGSTQTISGLGFSPDLVWLKKRGGDAALRAHQLFDVVRGANKSLCSNLTDAEFTDTDALTSFNSDGFSLGAEAGINTLNDSLVAWAWDAGSSTVTNTSGSITSSVRANASAGFSVVTFTTQASGTATVGHGLGVAPEFFIIKARSVANNWWCYHKSLATPQSNAIALNTTGAALGSTTLWNNTAPTSSVISFSSDWAGGNTIVVYAFAPVAGYSSFGTYTGDGSATGPVISGLGFQPYFVMIKASSTTGDWWMYDGVRSPSNPRINKLKANTSDAEDTAGEDVDFQSDGFQIKTSNSGLNQNAATYIYAAFA
jgi:hypothetical protein